VRHRPRRPPLFFSWHAPSSLHALLLLLACISKHYPLPQCASSLCCAVQCRQPKPELRERLAELGSVVASAKHKEWRTMAEIQVGGHTHWHPPPPPPPPPPPVLPSSLAPQPLALHVWLVPHTVVWCGQKSGCACLCPVGVDVEEAEHRRLSAGSWSFFPSQFP
jgi:hypothetical protein